MQPVSREIELKLALDPADAGRLKRHLGRALAAEKPRRQSLVSVYFDTPEFLLRDAGLSLRVRRVGRRTVQTVKAANGVNAGLFDRGEWEHQISRAQQPDLAAIQDTPLAALLDGRGPESLRPVFESRIRRTVYAVESGDSRINVALDQGEVDTGQQLAPVCELELELMHGEAAALFSTARALAEIVPLKVAVQSKADRGYALVNGEPHPVEMAADVNLVPAMTCADAFRLIAHSGLRQLAANEPAIGPDQPEALHQMRVGLRRVRAAMSVFRAIVHDNRRNHVRSELKWLSGTLGPARDLDVFMAEVLVPLQSEHPDHPGLAAIFEEIDKRRQHAYDAAAAACRSGRYQRLLLDVAEWVESGPWRTGDDPLQRMRREQPITTLAADELSRRRRKIIKAGKDLRSATSQQRHQLRIRGKKLRYATEFFAGVFPRKRSIRRHATLLSALKNLQDALGGLNDIVTRATLALKIAQEGDGDSQAIRERAFAAGMIVGLQDGRRNRLLNAAERAYADVAASRAFWI